MTTLGEAYPIQQEPVRELLEFVVKTPGCEFAAAVYRNALKQAEAAAVSGDLPRMIAAYKELESCE